MTYYELATRLTLVEKGDVEYSTAVAMGFDNAVVPEVVVFHLSGSTDLAIVVQGSNDRENWSDLGGTISPTTPGYYTLAPGSPLTDVGTAFVRLKYTISDSLDIPLDIAVLASGLNTFRE